MPLTLRPAMMDDAGYLYALRTDPETVAMSSDQRAITLEGHCAWLKKRLTIEHPLWCAIYVAEVDGVPVGTGRLDRAWDALSLKIDRCLIGYSIERSLRGRGYGTLLVAALVREGYTIGYGTVGCRIRRTNTKSLLCAAKAGVTSIELF